MYRLNWAKIQSIANPVPDRLYCLSGTGVTIVMSMLSLYAHRWMWTQVTDADWDTIDATIAALIDTFQDGNDSGSC